MTPAGFYVYEHWRPDKGLPFYVGKGHGKRAAVTQRNNKFYMRVVRKLKRAALEIEIRKVFTGLSEDMSLTLEKSQISYWRSRGIMLTNITDGGDGISGYRFTEKQKREMSETLKALPPEVWNKIKTAVSKARKGYVHSAESCRKMSVSQTGRKHPEETKQKMRKTALIREAKKRELGIVQQGHGGFKHSEETKQVLREKAILRAQEKRRKKLEQKQKEEGV